MKQFDEWWKNEPQDFHLVTQKELAKIAWKTALKWAKSMHNVSNEPRFNLNITKELEEE